MKSCPIRTPELKASLKRNGKYKTYYSYNKYNRIVSPAFVSNDYDKDHFIMPGVRDYYKLNKAIEKSGGMTWFTSYLKDKGYTDVLYRDPENDNIYYEDYQEGRIPVAIKSEKQFITNQNTDDLEADIDKILPILKNGYDSIRFLYKFNGDSNIIIYAGDRLELNTEAEEDDFKNYLLDKRNEAVNDETQWSVSDLQQENINLKNIEEEMTDDTGYSSQIGKQFADKISEQLGIDYEILSEDEARELDPNYNGETSFFLGKKVYFIEGKMTAESVFHEFCHPFIRSLRKENKTLFDKIYNEFIKTDAGRNIESIVRSKYDYPNDNYYKEEILVYALQEAAKKDGMLDVKNILYGIKNQMRQDFGKNIKISKLNVDTTLLDLAKILQSGGKIEFDKTTFLYDDIIMYFKKELVHDIESSFNFSNSHDPNLLNIIDDLFKITDMAILKSNSDNYKDIVSDEIKENFRKIKAYINKYRSDYIGIHSLADDALLQHQSKALATSLAVFDEIIDKVFERVKSLSYSGSDEALMVATHYNRLTESWMKALDQMDENAESNGLTRGNEFRTFLSRNKGKIKDIKSMINNIFKEQVTNGIVETLTPMMENLEKQHLDRLEYLRTHGAPEWRIEQEYQEFYGMNQEQKARFDSLKNNPHLTTQEKLELQKLAQMSSKGLHLDKSIIEGMLTGNLGDISFINSMFSSYLTNVDPIVGGFALYLKNGINECLANAQMKMVSFCNDIKPLLDKVGYNPNNPEDLRNKLCFKDKVGVFNPETGEIEQKEVWSYKYGYKDWRYERAVEKQKVENALQRYRSSNSEEDKKAYFKAKWDYDKFTRTYFNQIYTSEYYKKYDAFEKFDGDEIGYEAYMRMQELFERMNLESEGDYTYIGGARAHNNAMSVLWQEYGRLASGFNIDGTPKTGRELEISKRIKEYRDSNKEFFESEFNEKKFESFYKGFMEEKKDEYLDAKGIKKGMTDYDTLAEAELATPEYAAYKQDAYDEFCSYYIRPKVKDTFYAYRQSILDEIKTILDRIPADEASERRKIDITKLWEQIFQLTAGYRNEQNEIAADQLSAGVREKIKDLEDEIDLLKTEEISSNGLTRAENDEYIRLKSMDFHGAMVTGSPEDIRLQELERKKVAGGLPFEDARRLRDLYDELKGLTKRNLTSTYIDHFKDLMNGFSDHIKDELKARFGDTVMDDISQDNIRNILEDESFCNTLMADNAEFSEFIQKEHRIKTNFDFMTSSTISHYEPLYCWVQVVPTDTTQMEKYELDIMDEEGISLVDHIEFNGMPTMEFYDRRVKDRYRTPIDIGITKDNQGQFLPKSKEQMDADYPDMPESERYKFIDSSFEELRQGDSNAFELLEKMKQYHLDFQKGTGRTERLWYDVPRFEKNAVEKTKEALHTGPLEVFRRWLKRIKDWLLGAAQDSGNLLNYNTAANLVRADIFADNITEIRIDGLQNIAMENQSANIITNELRFMSSAEKHKQLVKMSPLADALKQVLADKKNAVKESLTVDKNSFLQGVIKRINKYRDDNESNRENSINILIDREFKGIMNDRMSDNAFINNLLGFLEGKASFAFFAFNPISSLKNAIGMKYNYVIEGAAGQWVNTTDLTQGNVWATKAVAEHIAHIHDGGVKPLRVQMAEIFDFNQDKFFDEMGKSMSRTALSDVVEGKVFYNSRKALELQGIYQYGAAILNHETVEMFDEAGNRSVIKYIDAFELDPSNRQIKLKKGIDVRYSQVPTMINIGEVESIEDIAKKCNIPESDYSVIETAIKHKQQNFTDLKAFYNNRELEYNQEVDKINLKYADDEVSRNRHLERAKEKFDKDVENRFTIKIDNTKFKAMKNKIHGLENHAGGAYAKFDQPAAQRNFLYKAIFFLRKYAPAMLDKRFGMSNVQGIFDTDNEGNFKLNFGKAHGRRNYLLGDVNNGYYSTTIKWLFSNLQHLNQGAFKTMTADERRAIFRTIADMFLWFSMYVMVKFVFGFDDDDPDKYKKLRQKSGAMPLPWTTKEASDGFNALGWSELFALDLMLQVQTENSQFALFDPQAFKNYSSLIDMNPYFMGPTIEAWQRWYSVTVGALGEDDARSEYSRNIGPYKWQEKGDWKLWNYFLKTFGINGSTIDPLLGIQNQVSFAQKATNR